MYILIKHQPINLRRNEEEIIILWLKIFKLVSWDFKDNCMLLSFIIIQPLIPDFGNYFHLDVPPTGSLGTSLLLLPQPWLTTIDLKRKKKKKIRFRWKQVGQSLMCILFFLHLILYHEHLSVVTYQCPPNHIYCCCSVSRLCPALCDPMDYNLPGSSVNGVSQARILEWVAISVSYHIYNAVVFHCMNEHKYNLNIIYAIHRLNIFYFLLIVEDKGEHFVNCLFEENYIC